MSDSSPDTHHLIEEASNWLVLLRSGQASEAQKRAFKEWREEDPRHEHLCAKLEQNLSVFKLPMVQGIGSDGLHRTLENGSRRKLLQGALVGAGLMFGAGFVSSRLLFS